MKKILCFLVPALATTLLLTACEVGSADDVAPVVSSGGNTINVNGVYRNPDVEGSSIVSPANSGSDVIYLDLRQNGDRLEAVDDNKKVFKGSIGAASEGNRVSFVLEGQTTIGRSVTISGTITVENGVGKMRATWIEPDRYGTVKADALGPSSTPRSLIISGPKSISAGESESYTATGGGSEYSWSTSNSNLGGIEGTGSTVQYVAKTNATSGVQTLTVVSGSATGRFEVTHQP